MASSLRLTVIIVNYNTKNLVEIAVRSVLREKNEDWEVVVVDNASTDGSVKFLKERFPHLKLIESKKNLGFAAGNNVALRGVRSRYIMLLNSDASFIQGENLEEILKYMDENPSVAVVSPKVVLQSGKLDPASHRGFPTPWNAVWYYLGFEKLFTHIPFFSRLFGGYHQTWKSVDDIHEIDACSGAAMIVRTKAVEEVGLLDEDYFMYGEDLDWCYRFRKNGWKIVFYPKVRVLHIKHQSGIKRLEDVQTVGVRKQTQKVFFDTMIQFYQKHYQEKYPTWFLHLIKAGVYGIAKMKGATYAIKSKRKHHV